jgi:hypothetical protein
VKWEIDTFYRMKEPLSAKTRGSGFVECGFKVARVPNLECAWRLIHRAMNRDPETLDKWLDKAPDG